MSRSKDQSFEFDRARDELFSHIHRCGVLRATPDQQTEWMDDTVEFIAERYAELSREQLGELRIMGLRFCRPVISHAREETATETKGESTEAEAAAA